MEKCFSKESKIEEFQSGYVLPLVVLHGVGSLSTTMLNGLVMWTTWRTPSLHSPSRIMLAALALSDFLLGTVCQPMFILYCIAALNKWTNTFCITWALNTRVGFSLAGISLAILTCISVDRFLAIKTSSAYKTIVTKVRVAKLMFFSWIFVALIVTTSLEFLETKSCMKITSVLVSIALTIITVSYTISFKKLRKMAKVSNGSSTKAGFNVGKYRKSLFTMFINVVLNVLAYVPLITFIGVSMVVQLENKAAYFHYGQFVIALSATINPIFYLWRMADLRNASKQQLLLLRNLFCC